MDILALDLETHLIQRDNKAPKPICLSYCYADGDSNLIKGLDEIEKFMNEILDDAIAGYLTIIAHNAAFDFACLLEYCPSLSTKIWEAYSFGRITCTKIREQLLDISIGEFRHHANAEGEVKKHGYSLADIVERRLDKTLDKSNDTWRLRYSELEDVPLENWPQEAKDYSLLDSWICIEVYQDQERRMHNFRYEMWMQYDDSMADLGLYLTTAWGFETDQYAVFLLWENTVNMMYEIVPSITNLCEVVKNPKTITGRKSIPDITKKMKPIKELISSTYIGNEIPMTVPTKRNPEGNIKTDAKTIQECDSEELQKLLTFNKLQKIANTYVSKLFYPIIHPNYNAVGAVTGRTSSYDLNIQNQPNLPGLRECLRAREGCVLIACDYNAQEVRTFAQSCIDLGIPSTLAKKFQIDKDYDPHLDFASSILQISFDEAKERYLQLDKEIKSTRKLAKVGIFGYFADMSPNTFVGYAKSFGVNISLQRSHEVKAKLWIFLPEMPLYFDNVRNVSERGIMEIPRSGFRRADVGYCDTANGYFQGLASHATKSAVFKVSRACYDRSLNSLLYGSRIVAMIHDEIVLESRREWASVVAKELETVMVRSQEQWTPDVPAAASATMMINWSKNAEEVYENGELVPWKK